MLNEDPEFCICGEPLDDGMWFCSRDCEEQYQDATLLDHSQMELFNDLDYRGDLYFVTP